MNIARGYFRNWTQAFVNLRPNVSNTTRIISLGIAGFSGLMIAKLYGDAAYGKKVIKLKQERMNMVLCK